MAPVNPTASLNLHQAADPASPKTVFNPLGLAVGIGPRQRPGGKN